MQDEYANARFVVRTERPETHADASLPLIDPAVPGAVETEILSAYRAMPRKLQ